MKIEMGESLFYSWLRHIKECQVVQTNWKRSQSWQLRAKDKLQLFMEETNKHFQNKYGYDVYKKNNSLDQLLRQAEIDAVGLNISENGMEIYSIDVAFHESGLHYGSRKEMVASVIKKLLRAAMCIAGYFHVTKGDIIFASPKIGTAVLEDLRPCVDDINAIFSENNYNFSARVIANDDFNVHILEPILLFSEDVSDTSELFMRSYQLLTMFGVERPAQQQSAKPKSSRVISDDTLSELKVGKIAQTLLREALESGKANDEEISLMQTKDYSKKVFGIDFPLLVPIPKEQDFDSVRYYVQPLTIQGKQYLLCSQWYEDDRPFLLAWLKGHGIE